MDLAFHDHRIDQPAEIVGRGEIDERGLAGAGIALDFAHINPIRALFWTAVINGLLAPFLMVGILIVASDRKLMNGQPSSRLGRTAVLLATLLMFLAAVGMFVF